MHGCVIELLSTDWHIIRASYYTDLRYAAATGRKLGIADDARFEWWPTDNAYMRTPANAYADAYVYIVYVLHLHTTHEMHIMHVPCTGEREMAK